MNSQFERLIDGYLTDSLSAQEEKEFIYMMEDPANRAILENAIEQKQLEKAITGAEDVERRDRNLLLINQRIEKLTDDVVKLPVVHRVHLLKTAWFRVAVAVLVLITAGTWYWMNSKSIEQHAAVVVASQEPILPGSDKAILTLSNGEKIVLSDSANRVIADGKVSINSSGGTLKYNSGLTSENASVGYNTMSTPRGGQYHLVLPDGSEAWLNSASSLRFPTQFLGNNRTVELTGEGYFDIKKNRTKPFIVKTKRLDVTVLGTEFNVNAYDDEPALATTLVNGSVKITEGSRAVIITPGQQARFNYSGGELNTATPKMEEVIAWRQGKFKFNRVNIQFIMRQISRWYDVDVEYIGAVPQAEFNGSLLRTENPMVLLNALTLTDQVHFEVSNKKIKVFRGPKPKL